MRIVTRVVLVLIVIGSVFASAPASAETLSPSSFEGCQQGVFVDTGASWLICVPPGGVLTPPWNGDMLVFAHGYVQPGAPLDFYHLTTPEITQPLPNVVMSLGYAFAATSYRENGLVQNGVDDVVQLTEYFWSVAGVARGRSYLVGASEGGLVTTLTMERAPDGFDGGLALCGPIGDFGKQINYLGDFRVLFDYFFPRVLPRSPIDIPSELIDGWDSLYAPTVMAELAANPDASAQLISTSKASIDPADLSTIGETTLGVLWYNVFATNDAVTKLGGNPFDNRHRLYWGSTDDWTLNRKVQRFNARPAAITALKNYQTSGQLSKPLVTMHTTGDPIVPFWHEILYATKATLRSPGKVIPIPINSYGHCSFTQAQVMAAFGVLVWATTGQQPSGLSLQFDPQQVQSDWVGAQQTYVMPDFVTK